MQSCLGSDRLFTCHSDTRCRGRISILFTDAQFAIVLTFVLFAFFFMEGYKSDKKSGGFFMLFAGFIFLAFNALVVDLFDSLILVFISPFGIFIMLLGIIKAFITGESKANAKD